MTLLASFHHRAEEELNEAAAFYGRHSRELARGFLEEVEVAVRQVLEFPEASPIVKGIVRRKLVGRFPYSVFYSILPDEIRILAIGHQKRRPFYWAARS
jgi:toxin ParE1/3/4